MKGVALHSFAALLVTCGAFLTKSWWEGSSTEFTVAVVAILIAGVPHGSLDHEVEGRTSKKFQLLRFLVMYIIVAFIYLGVWMIWPGIAFIIFLLITAWHFGETDFHSFQLKNHNPSLLFYMAFPSLCGYWCKKKRHFFIGQTSLPKETH